MKECVNTDSKVDISLRDIYSANSKASNDLQEFFKVDSIVSTKRKKELESIRKIAKTRFLSKEEEENKKLGNGSMNEKISLENEVQISYLPKRKVKFTPLNIMSYPNPASSKFTINDKNNFLPLQYTNQANGIEKFNSEKLPIQNSGFSKLENEYMNFKTSYVLKYARNMENLDKLKGYLDIISDDNKKYVIDYFKKIKFCSERKDNALFDTTNFAMIFDKTNKNNNMNSYQQWKDITTIFHELEVYWIKFADIFLREMKTYKENNIQLSKKVNDLSLTLNSKEKELTEVNKLIENFDLKNKLVKEKRKKVELDEIRQEYDKKDKVNMYQVFRLEEEIKDLTSLLDKDKDFYYKYMELVDQMEVRKKEIEEMRMKYNEGTDEKKLKIAYLNNEKHELEVKIKTLENDQIDLKKQFDLSRKEFIDFHTQIKILRQTLEEKKENIEMLTEEADLWRHEYTKEVQNHNNTQQIVTALEIKIQALVKEKIRV